MIVDIYIGLLALMLVGLSFNVILRRLKNRMPYGDGGNPALMRAIRAQGNFIEYVPLILLMLYAYETQAGSRYVVHALGILLILGRSLHVWGLMGDKVPGRIAGTVLTQLSMVMLAVMLLVKGVRYMTMV